MRYTCWRVTSHAHEQLLILGHGYRWGTGSQGLRDNYPLKNARQVDLLQARGAVILGKSNMGEFALSPDESVGSMFGIVRHPYNLDYTTAGYSPQSPRAPPPPR